MARATNAIVVWTSISVVLAAIGAVALIWTLVATRAGVEVMRGEQRPWVCFFEYDFTMSINGSTPDGSKHNTAWIFAIAYKNFGKTPALRIRSTLEYVILPDGEEPVTPNLIDPDHDSPFAYSNLAPDAQLLSRNVLLTGEELRAMWQGDHAIYLYGRIRYEGTLGSASYTTRVCIQMIYTGTQKDKEGNVIGIRFSAVPKNVYL